LLIFRLILFYFNKNFVHHPKLFPTILKLIYVDGCTNILIQVITMVSELMRSQIQLEFAVCNSHTRKMKSISG
jgi:uncharacterized metal-binding protein